MAAHMLHPVRYRQQCQLNLAAQVIRMQYYMANEPVLLILQPLKVIHRA